MELFEIRLEGFNCEKEIIESGFPWSKLEPNSNDVDLGDWHTFARGQIKVVSLRFKYDDGKGIYEYNRNFKTGQLKEDYRPHKKIEEPKPDGVKPKESQNSVTNSSSSNNSNNNLANQSSVDKVKKELELRRINDSIAIAKQIEADRIAYERKQEELKQRSEEQRRQNLEEDVTMGAAIGSVFAIGSSSTSNWSDWEYHSVGVGAKYGVDLTAIPVITNYGGPGFKQISKNSAIFAPQIRLALDFRLLSDRFFTIKCLPYYHGGLLMGSSETGGIQELGIKYGVKFGDEVQLSLNGSIDHRSGSSYYDAVDIGIDGWTYSTYFYNFKSYGIGIRKMIEDGSFGFQYNMDLINLGGTLNKAHCFDIDYEEFGMAFSLKLGFGYPRIGPVDFPSTLDLTKKGFLFQIGMEFVNFLGGL